MSEHSPGEVHGPSIVDTAPMGSVGASRSGATGGTPRDGQRDCPTCGDRNPGAREICRACGADLDTGDALPAVSPVAGPPRAPTAQRGVGPRGVPLWWLPLAIVLGAALTSIVALAVMGVGPFADTTPPITAEVAHDVEVYSEERVVLELSDVATRTTRGHEDGRDYAPEAMVDDDPSTAWRSDGEETEDGAGEVIELFLETPAWVEMLVVRNGDHLDADSYERTARIQRALVTFDGDVAYVLNLLDLGREAQAVELPSAVHTSVVHIAVVETFPGVSSPDLTISDIEVWGRTAPVQPS